MGDRRGRLRGAHGADDACVHHLGVAVAQAVAHKPLGAGVVEAAQSRAVLRIGAEAVYDNQGARLARAPSRQPLGGDGECAAAITDVVDQDHVAIAHVEILPVHAHGVFGLSIGLFCVAPGAAETRLDRRGHVQQDIRKKEHAAPKQADRDEHAAGLGLGLRRPRVERGGEFDEAGLDLRGRVEEVEVAGKVHRVKQG